MPTVDIQTHENVSKGRYERSDVCVVPAAGVVGEAMLAMALMEAWLEKFGGDSMAEAQANVQAYQGASLHVVTPLVGVRCIMGVRKVSE